MYIIILVLTIASWAGGTTQGIPQKRVTRTSGMLEASPNHAVFFGPVGPWDSINLSIGKSDRGNATKRSALDML